MKNIFDKRQKMEMVVITNYLMNKSWTWNWALTGSESHFLELSDPKSWSTLPHSNSKRIFIITKKTYIAAYNRVLTFSIVILSTVVSKMMF